MTSKKNDIDKAASLFASAKSVCVLTGAGISAESGIKTFRDADGLWENHPISKVATPEGFDEDPQLVWAFYNARRRAAGVALPNPAHLALSRFEVHLSHRAQKGSAPANGHANGHRVKHSAPKPLTLLTQNIDGLHQQAGSQNVVELHGSIWKVRCTGCDVVSQEFPLELPILPYCDSCRKLLRPHVVWFGESLEPAVLDAAEAAVEDCDLFVVIGTSAVVQPAASYPFMAASRGVPVIEVNKEATPVTTIAEISLLGLAGEILPVVIP